MKFVSFLQNNNEKLGLLSDNKIYDLKKSAGKINLTLPDNMLEFLWGGERNMDLARKVNEALKLGNIEEYLDAQGTNLLAPVPHPTSCRDAYAFRQHVATARRNRGVEMIPEFDQFPVFYFTNHNAILGEGVVPVE